MGRWGYRLLAFSPYHPLQSQPFFPQNFCSVHHSHPQRLSLLELVLDEESVSMVLRRMSPATGSSGDLGDSVVALIQGWSQICSRVGRSEGLRAKHHLISCWHSEGVEEGTKTVRIRGSVNKSVGNDDTGLHISHWFCSNVNWLVA